jgi:hypothetical protein
MNMQTKSKNKLSYPDSYRDRPAAAGVALEAMWIKTRNRNTNIAKTNI